MLFSQDKGPIFNDMKCHCGVYSSFCVFLKSWIEHFGGLETYAFLAHFSDILDHFIALFFESIYDEYVLETLQNKGSELHIINFCIFCQVFVPVMHRVSVSILLMPEMPARRNSFAFNVDLN